MGVQLEPEYAIDLMHLDSVIAEKVMLYMMDVHNTVALPVHDSFIVKKRYESEIFEAMTIVHSEVAGDKLDISHKENENPSSAQSTNASGAASGIDSSTSKWKDKVTEQLIKIKDDF